VHARRDGETTSMEFNLGHYDAEAGLEPLSGARCLALL
jgi:hypothetical protein